MDIEKYYNDNYDLINNTTHDIYNHMQQLQAEYYKKYTNYLSIEGGYNSFVKDDKKFNTLLNYKIINLLWCMNLIENNNNPNILEIGFNTGYSSSIMMIGLNNKKPNYYIFDYGIHSYINSCLDLFKSKFQNKTNNISFIEGDSIITLPDFIKNNQNLIGTFDFIHIDGGHSEECIKNDFMNCDILIKNPNGIIIIDDTNIPHINNEVDFYLNNKNYVELFFFNLEDFQHPHRIIKKK
jgi:predicted O-methyltransferase YrrM